MPAARQPLPLRPGRALAYLGGFFAFGIGTSAVYLTTGTGLPCPFRSLTGWECPLCGGTRLGEALLRGDAVAAFAANPVVFVGLGVLTLLGVLWAVEALGGPAVRPPRRWLDLAAAVHPTRWTVLVLVAGAVYVLLRNLR